MQKNVKILGESIINFTNIKDAQNRLAPIVIIPKIQANIDKRWQEIKVVGQNLKSRSFHAICLHENYLYTYGGYENNERMCSTFARLRIQNSDDSYKWEIITPKSTLNPGTRRRHTLICHQNKIYLFGGQTSNWQSVSINDVYVYDIKINEWILIKNNDKNIIPQLDTHNAFVYQDEMFIFGGYSSSTTGYSNALYAFHFIKQTWRVVSKNQPSPNTISKRSGSSLSIYKDYIYVFGGQSEGEKLNDLWRLNLDQIKQTNKVKWEFLQVEGDLPQIRNGHQSIVYKDYLFVFGGIHNLTKELNDVHAYDIKENRWIQVHTDSNMLYASSPAQKHKRNKHLEVPSRSDSRESIRNSLKRADSSSTPNKHNSPSKQTNRQSQFKRENSHQPLKRRDSNESGKNRQMRNLSFTENVIQQSFSREMTLSPGRYLVEKKQKQFQQKKQHFLSSIEVGITPQATKKQESKDTLKDQKIKLNDREYLRNDSPMTVALKNSLVKIGNQGGRAFQNSSSFMSINTPQFNQNANRNGNKSFSNQLLDTRLPPVLFEKGKNILMGKKPCARDGHACVLVRNNQLLIYGGDRHNMSFNDMYLFDLELAIAKHIICSDQ